MDYDYDDQDYDHFNPEDEDLGEEASENTGNENTDNDLPSNSLNNNEETNNQTDLAQENSELDQTNSLFDQSTNFSSFQNFDESAGNDIYNDDEDNEYNNDYSKSYNDDDEVEREEPEETGYDGEAINDEVDDNDKINDEIDDNDKINDEIDENDKINNDDVQSSPIANSNDPKSPQSPIDGEPPSSPINNEEPNPPVNDEQPSSSFDLNKDDQNEPTQINKTNQENEGEESQLIADIFGDSESEEEFEGFKKGKRVIDDDEDDDGVNINKDQKEDEAKEENAADQGESSNVINSEQILPDVSSDESDEEAIRKRKVPEDFVYDFDIMMQKRKDSIRRRKPKNVDFINNSDDAIADLIQEMKQAAEDDFLLNKDGKAATRKLKLLPTVETQLRKIDLKEAFLDAGVLNVITDWLTPLPDRSLPTLQVRETMIKLLNTLKIDDVERLKASGVGKAVMYLYKHPKETKENKKRANILISSWSRPIFNLDTNFHSMSKEEREQRDFEHMTKTKRKLSDIGSDLGVSPAKSKSGDDRTSLRPGEKGWVARARVPMPSTRDYVVRPRSTVEIESSRGGSKKPITRLDKHIRNFREKKKMMKTPRAVSMSIEGRKM